MPKLTFFNLSVDKKQMIIESAKEEFDLYTLKGAKVVRIIKRVNISRASFYKYFECLEDLYFYILNQQSIETLSILRKELIKYDGDFFKSWKKLFENYINTPELYSKNINRIFNHHFNEALMYARKYDIELKEQIVELSSLVDFDKLTVEKENFYHLLSVSVSIVERILSYLESGFYDKEKASLIFTSRMKIVTNGQMQ